MQTGESSSVVFSQSFDCKIPFFFIDYIQHTDLFIKNYYDTNLDSSHINIKKDVGYERKISRSKNSYKL